MANHIINILEFENELQRKEASRLLGVFNDDRPHVDFNALVPQPIYIYRATFSTKKSNDFEPFTWETWRRLHWGGKRNAMDTKIRDNLIYFVSETYPPFAVIIALANKLLREFKHIYYDMGADSVTIDEWGFDSFNNQAARISSTSNEAIYRNVLDTIDSWDV